MLEVLDEGSGPKADALAAKLRNLFHEDMLRVTRPVKCAELRVAGLDDSCGGGDSPGRNSVGLGTAFVRCPVSAAKKVVTSPRLLV
ncbi:Gag-like protein, partial [Operophtera brumata]